jgi:hypothetical protein
MRSEHDLLGEKLIPDDAYYGVQSARAILLLTSVRAILMPLENFCEQEGTGHETTENCHLVGQSSFPELVRAGHMLGRDPNHATVSLAHDMSG